MRITRNVVALTTTKRVSYILYRGNKSKFSNAIRKEAIDVTLPSNYVTNEINKCRISEETFTSAQWHNVLLSEKYSAICKNIKTVENIEVIQKDLQDSIQNAHKQTCTEKIKRISKSHTNRIGVVYKIQKPAGFMTENAKETLDAMSFKHTSYAHS